MKWLITFIANACFHVLCSLVLISESLQRGDSIPSHPPLRLWEEMWMLSTEGLCSQQVTSSQLQWKYLKLIMQIKFSERRYMPFKIASTHVQAISAVKERPPNDCTNIVTCMHSCQFSTGTCRCQTTFSWTTILFFFFRKHINGNEAATGQPVIRQLRKEKQERQDEQQEGGQEAETHQGWHRQPRELPVRTAGQLGQADYQYNVVKIYDYNDVDVFRGACRCKHQRNPRPDKSMSLLVVASLVFVSLVFAQTWGWSSTYNFLFFRHLGHIGWDPQSGFDVSADLIWCDICTVLYTIWFPGSFIPKSRCLHTELP